MRKRFLILLCIVSSLAFVLAFYFFYSSSDKEIVTLSPDEGATKIKPSDPGGVIIPYSDNLVYSKLHSKDLKPDKISISPDPEEPINIIRNTTENQPQFLDSIDAILANIEHYEQRFSEAAQDDEDTDYIMPNMLQTKEVESDASKTSSETISILGTKLKVTKAIENRYKTSNIRVVSKGEKGYKIQLSSAYSAEDANKEWYRIQQKHTKILRDTHLIVKKVEGKNERIFYLIMAGTYPSLNHAKLVCKHLVAKKQNCIVTK